MQMHVSLAAFFKFPNKKMFNLGRLKIQSDKSANNSFRSLSQTFQIFVYNIQSIRGYLGSRHPRVATRYGK
jgi:hypothetical protein